ncbi:hypothetical protein [Frigidibacter sp. SD6-1]|uniref:hypothetical protein n=1 Tax=Frigidibacter sp. SD6-1 TaxID=3032581 RepID=UPI0024DFBE3E|nr:hypothetical protein [Frigidibacter sp. SD6-1]
MRLTTIFSAVLVTVPLLANAQPIVFNDIDLDKDGYLSWSELTAEYPNFQEADLVMIDLDGNQKVDNGEFLSALENDRIDALRGVMNDSAEGDDG